MPIAKHLDKNNLHHAYLIEGARDEVVPEITDFFEKSGFSTSGNSDFVFVNVDSFKMEDARNLKSYAMEKSFASAPKIFVISANNFLLDAQNSLLKMFEEPIPNTHFLLVVPDINALLKTFASRFYVISDKTKFIKEEKEVEKFIAMHSRERIDFIKELLADPKEEDEDGNDAVILDSARLKALRFINTLEALFRERLIAGKISDPGLFEHIFKVREALRMPGSSAKNLMESVALITPQK